MQYTFHKLAQLIDCNAAGVPCGERSFTVARAFTIMSGIAAAVCVLMIVIGGFRYTISAGDPQNIARAKNTIIYALIGLVVSISAFSIAAFVLRGL